MDLTCLNGLIGVYCSTSSGSEDSPVFYLSDLPAINLENSAKVADGEVITGAGLMSKAISFSQKIVAREFLQLFRKQQLFREVISSSMFGVHGREFSSLVDKLIGVSLEIYDFQDRYISGYIDYMELNVENSVTGVDVTIEIDQEEPIVKTIDLKEGLNRVQVGLKFRQTARVYIDGNDVDLSNPTSTWTSSHNCINNCCDGCIKAIPVESPTTGSPVWTSTSGNGIVLSLICKGNPEELICQFRDEIATPLLYRSGAYIMEETISSSRGNPYVRNTKDEAREILLRIMGGRNEITGIPVAGQYQESLEQVVANAIAIARDSSSKAFQGSKMIIGDLVQPLVTIPKPISRRYLYPNNRNIS